MKNIVGIQVRSVGRGKVCTSRFMLALVKSAEHAHSAAVAGTFSKSLAVPLAFRTAATTTRKLLHPAALQHAAYPNLD